MGNREESRRWGVARMAARGARVAWASGQMGRHPSGRRRWGRGDGRTSTPSRIPPPATTTTMGNNQSSNNLDTRVGSKRRKGKAPAPSRPVPVATAAANLPPELRGVDLNNLLDGIEY